MILQKTLNNMMHMLNMYLHGLGFQNRQGVETTSRRHSTREQVYGAGVRSMRRQGTGLGPVESLNQIMVLQGYMAHVKRLLLHQRHRRSGNSGRQQAGQMAGGTPLPKGSSCSVDVRAVG